MLLGAVEDGLDFRTVLLSCDASSPQPRSRATFDSYKIKTSSIQAP